MVSNPKRKPRFSLASWYIFSKSYWHKNITNIRNRRNISVVVQYKNQLNGILSRNESHFRMQLRFPKLPIWFPDLSFSTRKFLQSSKDSKLYLRDLPQYWAAKKSSVHDRYTTWIPRVWLEGNNLAYLWIQNCIKKKENSDCLSSVPYCNIVGNRLMDLFYHQS